MKILLLETSSGKIEFGYAEDNNFIVSKQLSKEENADSLIYNIKLEFENAKLSASDIEVVSLSNGPGSFTGLRIGSAVAKGICMVNQCKLVEIPTLDIIANKYKKDGEVISAIFSNSKTNEFYYSNYKIENHKIKRTSDYKIGLIENFYKECSTILLNDEKTGNIPAGIDFINLSDKSNLPSQVELTIEYIDKSLFSDFNKSEPFYMKEFIPVKK
jgi:tRNA threonylcarbamoyladenosine biosynthesis protein TsaB